MLVNRDLGYMRDFLGAPIRYERATRTHGYDPAAPRFELPGLWLNESELYSLLAWEHLLKHLLEHLQPGLLTPFIKPLRTRIRRLLAHSGHSAAAVGIFSGSAKAWAVLRFGAEASRWVADETWHPEQIGHWDSSCWEVQVPYSDPRELLMQILKYGPEVEVVAPPALRRLVAERLNAAARLYPEDAAG